MPERNVELLQQTMQYIKDNPEQHKQDIWLNECGTAACFAGWAALLSGHSSSELYEVISRSGMNRFGADLLGLNYDEAIQMFEIHNSREMLEHMVKDLVNGDKLRDWRDYYEETHDL